ncbi:MAG TPA: RNA polymerase sigma factor, partial [Labilithrix sp.]
MVGSTMTLGEDALVHLDALHRFARRLSGSDDRARDLVQDTFARALAAREQFERGTNLRAWLFRILRNAFLDERRRAKVSPIVVAESDGTVAVDAEQLRNVVAD